MGIIGHQTGHLQRENGNGIDPERDGITVERIKLTRVGKGRTPTKATKRGKTDTKKGKE